jgi:hypothetical protein
MKISVSAVRFIRAVIKMLDIHNRHVLKKNLLIKPFKNRVYPINDANIIFVLLILEKYICGNAISDLPFHSF